MIYFLFKFIHISAAIIWIGSVFILSILNIRLTKTRDQPGLAVIANQNEFLGRAVIGPSAITTLIAGVVLSSTGFGWPFWVIWGFAVILITGFLGGNVIQKLSTKLIKAATSDNPDKSQLRILHRRLTVLSTITLLLLFSAVWAMVFKPVL